MTELAERLAARTLELCLVPSETGKEEAIAELVEAFGRERTRGAGTLQRIGQSVICDPCAGDEAWMDLPAVALVGHLDTVRCAETQRYEIADGRVYGCGASDMKAGISVMMELLDRWQELRSVRPVWIFYDAEEGPFDANGLEPVLRSGILPKLDLAFVLEPTDGAVQLGCMGTLHARVTVRGKRAHSARPWQGENALFRALPLLERLSGLARRAVQFGDLTFYEVITPTQATTYNSPNVVPDALALNLNVRFAPGRTPEEAADEVRALVGSDGDVEIMDAAPAGEVYLDHPLLSAWLKNESLALAPKQAWTDVARFTSRGIPALNFGPGETSQAHQADEWCSIESLESNCRSLLSFFGGEPPAPGSRHARRADRLGGNE
jgi:succinyl-diaminopimelate desuccinylase